MAEITVKSSKVVKTGTTSKGEWELIRVTSEDNTEYTTFDKKAKNLSPGAVIDIGEPIIKEGKIGFKDIVKVISEGTPASNDSKSPDMKKDDWAEKDRITRASIERQTSLKCAVEVKFEYKDAEKVIETANKFYAWLSNSKPAVIKPEPPKTKVDRLEEEGWETKPEPPPEPVTDKSSPDKEPTILTIQALLNWVASHGVKFNRSWVLKTFSFGEEKMSANPHECYLEISQMMDWK